MASLPVLEQLERTTSPLQLEQNQLQSRLDPLAVWFRGRGVLALSVGTSVTHHVPLRSFLSGSQ